MDAADLETYQVHLSQTEQALTADPGNEQLTELASELKQLIELTKVAVGQSEAEKAKSEKKAAAAAASSSAAAAQSRGAKAWGAGDECLAKYSGDDKWYPARITAVGGGESNRVFSIVFRGYNTTELLKAHEIKSLPASYQASSSSSSASALNPYGGGDAGGGGGGGAGAKRKLSKDEELERERKKKKNEKKLEVRAAKAKEQNEKQASWQKFAKKSEKKGIHIAGVSGTSIFKTPDNPYGKGGLLIFVPIFLFFLSLCSLCFRSDVCTLFSLGLGLFCVVDNLLMWFYVVGVTGSGKGMTENAPRPKTNRPKAKHSKEDDS